MDISLTPQLIPAAEERTKNRPLPEYGAQTDEYNPWPVHHYSQKLAGYIHRCPATWVEGQIIELNPRGRVTYLTLRDVEQEKSIPVLLYSSVLTGLSSPLKHGQRVVVRLEPSFWEKTGRLSMRASDIRTVGRGTLLEQLENLRKSLAEEGLFDPAHKKPLPFLPQRVGLITGRDSDACKDVIRNARLRWPAVQFEIREVAVQGAQALRQVTQALEELDALEEVDVIVIARGGGAMEDLLPFSEEALMRAVYRAQTPVVSAIGHEADNPILDEVADLRASTPTDAAKRIVPDMAQERLYITQLQASLMRMAYQKIETEKYHLAQVRSRPVLVSPQTTLLRYEEELQHLRNRSFTTAHSLLLRSREVLSQLRSRVHALSPQQTLERGYALVQDSSGKLVTSAQELHEADIVTLRFAQGSVQSRILSDANSKNN
ncbi:exodeoxyribonuclease VII large subunit [Rothia sp. CCM 9418]|uniref:exodeoxyribonuclease VII large subunit n=1 Tax=Rothia sp. CCM 9418 TaxID=3402661 RepID=UPI003AE3C63C